MNSVEKGWMSTEEIDEFLAWANDTEARDHERQMERQGQSRVYYIRFCCLVKIGYSGNPKHRLSQLPHHELLAMEKGGRELEVKRHEQFAHLRNKGEWFDYGPELQAHILELQGRSPMLVDTEAAATYGGVTVETIYRWAQEGRLTRYGARGKGGARWDVGQIPQWDGPESGVKRPKPPRKKS